MIFPHFTCVCCLLLLACCLLAKPVRSTLDTKGGYKTKTGSTSSVTITLNLTLTFAVSGFSHASLVGLKTTSVDEVPKNLFHGLFSLTLEGELPVSIHSGLWF